LSRPVRSLHTIPSSLTSTEIMVQLSHLGLLACVAFAAMHDLALASRATTGQEHETSAKARSKHDVIGQSCTGDMGFFSSDIPGVKHLSKAYKGDCQKSIHEFTFPSVIFPNLVDATSYTGFGSKHLALIPKPQKKDGGKHHFAAKPSQVDVTQTKSLDLDARCYDESGSYAKEKTTGTCWIPRHKPCGVEAERRGCRPGTTCTTYEKIIYSPNGHVQISQKDYCAGPDENDGSGFAGAGYKKQMAENGDSYQ